MASKQLMNQAAFREEGPFRRMVLLSVSLVPWILGIYLLPYAFPPTSFIAGASYEVGFNNAVAFTAHICLLALPAFFLARLLLPAQVELPKAFSLGGLRWAPSTAVWVVMGLHAAIFGALYGVKGEFVFAEPNAIQDGIFRLTMGDLPNSDFAWAYGPIVIYPEAILYPHVDIRISYALYFVLMYLAGLYLLYLMLQVVLKYDSLVMRWFVFFSVGFFNPQAGLNYTFERFLLPFFAVAATVYYFRTGRKNVLALAAGSLAFAVLYMMDTAAVALGGVLLFASLESMMPQVLALVRRPVHHPALEDGDGVGEPTEDVSGETPMRAVRRALAVLIGAGILVSTFFYFIDPSWRVALGYPALAKKFSSGFSNLPIYPTIPFLLMIALSVLAVSLVLPRLSRFRAEGDLRFILVGLGVALAIQRSAFADPDIVHIAYYSLPIILLCLALLPDVWHGVAPRRWLGMAVLVGFILPLQFHHALLFAPYVTKTIRSPNPEASSSEQLTHQGAPTVQAALRGIIHVFGEDKLYYFYNMEYYSWRIHRQYRLKYVDYCAVRSCVDHDDIRDLIARIQVMKPLVVAWKSDLADTANVHYPSTWAGKLLGSMAILTPDSPIHELIAVNQSKLRDPLTRYLRDSYVSVYESGGLVVMKHREGKTPL